MDDVIVYMVIPCYNEEAVLEETARRLVEKFESLRIKGVSMFSRIVFVNDGSTDGTWRIIQDLYNSHPLFGGINLSKNQGHQNALLAGLNTVKDYCDLAISMDADLQDDIDAVDEMLEKYKQGYDVVYGVRSNRDSDTYFKRKTAELYYKTLQCLGVNVVFNHADYRLMSKRALDGLALFKEVNLFLRGIVPMVGYPEATVYYERKERFAGESKYPLKKMLSFALEGITSLSIKPIRIITSLGAIIFLVSILMLVWSVAGVIKGTTVSGWASIMVSLWGIGGMLMLSIGVVGEYIGKIYMETKARPRYLVGEVLLHREDNVSTSTIINPQLLGGEVPYVFGLSGKNTVNVK